MLSRIITFFAAAALLCLNCSGVTIPPDPPLGEIQLHRNASTSSFYLTLNLTPESFTQTKGNATIGGGFPFPERYTYIDMFINYTTTPALATPGWTIWAIPTSHGGHEVLDPLTEVWIYHTIPVIYDCGAAPIGNVDELVYPEYEAYNDCGTGFPVFHEGAYGFAVSLNEPVYIGNW